LFRADIAKQIEAARQVGMKILRLYYDKLHSRILFSKAALFHREYHLLIVSLPPYDTLIIIKETGHCQTPPSRLLNLVTRSPITMGVDIAALSETSNFRKAEDQSWLTTTCDTSLVNGKIEHYDQVVAISQGMINYALKRMHELNPDMNTFDGDNRESSLAQEFGGLGL